MEGKQLSRSYLICVFFAGLMIYLLSTGNTVLRAVAVLSFLQIYLGCVCFTGRWDGVLTVLTREKIQSATRQPKGEETTNERIARQALTISILLELVSASVYSFRYLASGVWLVLSLGGAVAGIILILKSMTAVSFFLPVSRRNQLTRLFHRSILSVLAGLSVIFIFELGLQIEAFGTDGGSDRADDDSSTVPAKWAWKMANGPEARQPDVEPGVLLARPYYWHGELHVFNVEGFRTIGDYSKEEGLRIVCLGDLA